MSYADESKSADLLEVGARVEVRTGFDRSWSKGFVIESVDVDADGYRLRRRSDKTVLPGVFAAADVRSEHRSSMWWI